MYGKQIPSELFMDKGDRFKTSEGTFEVLSISKDKMVVRQLIDVCTDYNYMPFWKKHASEIKKEAGINNLYLILQKI